MADEPKVEAPVDAVNAPEEVSRDSVVPTDSAAVVGADPADSPEEAKSGEAGKATSPAETATAPAVNDEPTAEDLTPGEVVAADTEAAATTANGTPVAKKGGNNKRKSGAGIPEHKKKTPAKKKAAPELRLNVQPGEVWFVAMRGYPPWPVVVCDEEMLPETLLSKRPVSAKRIDGTYREDFREGGKNAKDRRYPIMFLGTNEFSWQVNTDLQPLDIDDVKKTVESGNQGKKSNALWEAYKIAAEGHDLQWFKDMLEEHEKALQADFEEKAAAEAKKQEKKEKSARRKSTVAVADESDDVEMEDIPEDDAPSAKKAKASKKRKKDTESDGEPEKPAKTPKTKLKLNNRTPKETSAAKPKKEAKPKKSKTQSETEEVEPAKVEEVILTPAERQEKREKSVLYLRHRLQKGFLTRDQPPKEEEMANMSEYFRQLEALPDLEAEVIRKTKVHKVLKAIIKLNSIPKEEEHQFKKRSNDLLNNWKLALSTDVETPTVTEAPAVPAANGVKEHAEEVKTDAAVGPTDAPPEKKPVDAQAAPPTDADGDTTMADSKEPATDVAKDDVKEDVPGEKVEAEATVEAAA